MGTIYRPDSLRSLRAVIYGLCGVETRLAIGTYPFINATGFRIFLRLRRVFPLRAFRGGAWGFYNARGGLFIERGWRGMGLPCRLHVGDWGRWRREWRCRSLRLLALLYIIDGKSALFPVLGESLLLLFLRQP